MSYLLQVLSIAVILIVFESQVATTETLLPQASQIAIDASPNLLAQERSREFEYKDFNFWVEQCSLLGGQQQYTEALAACEQAISLQPRRDNNVVLWAVRGDALLHLGRYADSIISYRRVVAASPNHSLAIASQCAALFQLNRYEDAIDTCEQALSIDGNWGSVSPAFAWYYRGLALRQLGRLETALFSFERAVAVDASDLPSLAEQCETLTELGRSVELLAHCNLPSAVDVSKENSSLSMIERCGILPANDRFDQFLINIGLQATVLCYERVLANNSQNITLWIQQGLALEQLGLFERAATAYGRAVELNPNHAISLVHHCGVLNQLQNYEAALKSCDHAFQVEGGLKTWKAAYGRNQRSVALLGLRRYEEALAAANQAIAIEQRYAPAWNSRALSLWWLNQGDAVTAMDQAIARYTQAEVALQKTFERTYPDSPIIIHRGHILALFNKGRILTSLEKYEQAAQAYSQALEVYNNAVSSARMSPLDQTALSEIWVNQAVAYLHTNPQEALNSTQQALALNRRSFAGWYNRGLAFASLGTPDSQCAFEAYREADRLNPSSTYALIGQGLALERLGFVQEAITRFEHVLSIDANNTLAQQHREALVSKRWSTFTSEGMQANNSQTISEIPTSRCTSDLIGQ